MVRGSSAGGRDRYRFAVPCGGGVGRLGCRTGAYVLDVPVVANWSMDSVPRAISADQVHRLLTSIDRATAVGRRDYAILLLLARLGLRLSEVAFLELDDIDWRTATLKVRAKGGMRNDFPLSHELGEAIAHYLRHGRASSHSRRVFLRVRAPIGGFRSPGGVGSVIRHALERAGIDAPTRGAHQFRHGLSTEMMRQGASLSEIGDVLGHRQPDPTRIYAKIDLDALRPLALPVAGRCAMNTLPNRPHGFVQSSHLGGKPQMKLNIVQCCTSTDFPKL